MPKRFKAFLCALVVLFLFCAFQIFQINREIPNEVREVQKSLPYTLNVDGTEVTVTDYAFGTKELDGTTYHTCTLFLQVKTGDVMPDPKASLFPFAMVENDYIYPDIQAYSENLRDPETRALVLEPNNTVEGSIMFLLSVAQKADSVRPALVMKPRAYLELYDREWDAGNLYLEFIPLEAKHVQS